LTEYTGLFFCSRLAKYKEQKGKNSRIIWSINVLDKKDLNLANFAIAYFKNRNYYRFNSSFWQIRFSEETQGSLYERIFSLSGYESRSEWRFPPTLAASRSRKLGRKEESLACFFHLSRVPRAHGLLFTKVFSGDLSQFSQRVR